MEKTVPKIVLGKKYKDKVHGFEGIVVARSEHLTGCDRVCMEWVKDGDIKCMWFDITQIAEIEVVEPKKGGVQKPPDRNYSAR